MTTNHEHTPSTEEVRLAHAESATFHKMEEPELTEANNMFDRWLATVEAAAEQRGAVKGYEVGYRDGMWDEEQVRLGRYVHKINPYRADRLEGYDD